MSNEPSGVGKPAGKGPGLPDGDTGDRGHPTLQFFWKSRPPQCARLHTHDSET
jgi:hypothetical protein